MNNNSLTKEVTILKTWKWEEFQIDMKYEDFLVFEKTLLNKWEDGFNSSDYRRYIKFSAIEDKIWKTLHLSLPPPKKDSLSLMWSEEKKLLKESNPQKYFELEQKDLNRRKNIENHSKKILDKIKPWIQKRFIEKRREILKKLAFDEKKHWLETTLEKLEKLEKFLKKEIIKIHWSYEK